MFILIEKWLSDAKTHFDNQKMSSFTNEIISCHGMEEEIKTFSLTIQFSTFRNYYFDPKVLITCKNAFLQLEMVKI